MAKFKVLGTIAMIATGLVGLVGYKQNQKLKHRHTNNTFSRRSAQNNSVTGVKISDINDKYLQELAMSIDRNPIYKGKKSGILENGKEMSIFLQQALNIVYKDKREARLATQTINNIADSANEDTYQEFKKYCYVRGDSGHKKSKLWPMLDRMEERFNSKTDISIIKNKKEPSVADGYEIDKGYSYESLVKIFYPSLIEFCGGSIEAAVFIFKYQTGIDDEESSQNDKIKLPNKINGFDINKNGFEKLKKLKKINV